MESRENLFKQYKKDWPQTVGETDKVFDNDNFIDWLCQRTKALTDEIEKLQSRISELEKANICPNCDGIINNEYHPYCYITFKQPTEKQSKEVYSDNPRYPLFKHLSDEYSLLLLDSELDEIINIAKQVDVEIEAVAGYVAFNVNGIISGIYSNLEWLKEDYPKSGYYKLTTLRNI